MKYRLSIWIFCLPFVLGSCLFCSGAAQPVMSSKMTIGNRDVYQDHQNPKVYYYGPPDIRIKTASSGSPSFLLLQMRYTGTHLYGDQDAKRFLNLLQVGVELTELNALAYDNIKTELPVGSDLKPLPISRFFAELIIPLGDAAATNEKYRKVSLSGIEAAGASTSGTTFWQERTFTMQLENYEAQLLWDQMKTGKLGVSFSYSFYAEVMPGQIGELQTSGTDSKLSDAADEIKDEVTFDDKVSSYLMKANTFPVYIPSGDFKNCLKQVDVNEELPPAYAAFEVKCYDFSDELRPELLKKIVEIKGYAAGKDFITTKAVFGKNNKDIISQVARFPYAIRLDHVLEYRITEINANGETSISPWIEKKNWAEIIDATTPGTINPIRKHNIDFEIDPESLTVDSIAGLSCEIKYQFNHNMIRQTLTWLPGDPMFMKSIQFSYDRDSPVTYRISTKYTTDGIKLSGTRMISPEDEYFFLNPHKE